MCVCTATAVCVCWGAYKLFDAKLTPQEILIRFKQRCIPNEVCQMDNKV